MTQQAEIEGASRAVPVRAGTGSGELLRTISGMELGCAHRAHPAGDAGRAYLDAFPLLRGGWGLLIGHAGPHAASIEPGDAIARSAIPTEQSASPAAVLREANRRLSSGLGTAGLGSAAFAHLERDVCGAWVTLACAGWPHAIVVRRAGWIDLRGQRGTTLGSALFEVDEDRVGLGPGDALVLYSDGLPRVRGPAGELFGDEALPATLLEHIGEGAATLASRLVEAAVEHAGDLPHDDLAVLAIRVPESWSGDPPHDPAPLAGHPTAAAPRYPVGEPYWGRRSRPAPPREARIKLAPDPATVSRARRFVEGVLHSWRMSSLADGDVQLITSELATNAVRYAGSPFTVLVNYDGDRVRIGVGDGSRVIPELQPAPEDLDALGGRGLALVTALAAGWGVTKTVEGKRIWAELDAPAEQEQGQPPGRV